MNFADPDQNSNQAGLLVQTREKKHDWIGEIDLLTLHGNKSRVAGYLTNCMSAHSQNYFKLLLSKAMIASRLTMKPETLSRALHSFDEKKHYQYG